MCGFSAYINTRGGGADSNVLDRMLASIVHRFKELPNNPRPVDAFLCARKG